jgi:hypothetical protein
VYSWKASLRACFIAIFVALLADEIGEHFTSGSWIHIASLIVFGTSMAVAFVSGCMAMAAFLTPQKSEP